MSAIPLLSGTRTLLYKEVLRFWKVYDRELPEFAGQPVDMKLVLLAKHLDGKLVTGDFNLNKVAKLHNIVVIDLNQVAAALRPQFLPGEGFQVRVVKPGEVLAPLDNFLTNL